MQQIAAIAPESSQFVSAASLRVRSEWFNKLRWAATGTTLAATLVAGVWARFPLPVGPLLVTVGLLAVLNAAYTIRNRRVPPADIRAEIRLLKQQMTGDLILLTVILNLTGGVENPLLYVYVIHVIIAALLFKGRETYTIAWLAIALFTAEVAGEYLHLLPHHHLLGASELTHELPFIVITLVSFWFVLLFSAYMGAMIMRHNRAIKDELVERQRRLVDADRAKLEFYRFVAHEVKSPVATAQSAVETALELGADSLSPQVEDLLTRAVGRLEQATAIVRNLADLTRGGLLAAESVAPVNVTALVRGVVADFHELAARQDQVIELDAPAIPVVITTSESMLGKVFTNLLSNAVRYNREGGTVRVTLADEGGRIRLTVADQGIGIEPADRERIFDEFYRAPAAQAKSGLGTGLGLPIVRRFVTDLGGAVAVDSRPGEGSVFTVTLPRRPAGAAAGGDPEGGAA